MITRPIEIAMVRCTSRTDARMVVVRSLRILHRDAGIDAFSTGRAAVARSHRIDDVRRRLAENKYRHCRLAVRVSDAVSATGMRHFGDGVQPDPGAIAMTQINGAYSRAFINWSVVLSDQVRFASEKLPLALPIGVASTVAHVFEAEAEVVQQVGLIDPHCRRGSPPTRPDPRL